MFQEFDQLLPWKTALGNVMFPLVRARKLPRAEARARAEESVDVVARLWDSWPDDAYPRDKVSGQFFRPEAFAPIHHKGPHFAVRGPLNVPRSPQGRPVIFQAGASEPGKVLAARSADGVFTATQTLADGQAYYRNLKRRLPGHGRAAGDVLVMPGIFPVIGRTRARPRTGSPRFKTSCNRWSRSRICRTYWVTMSRALIRTGPCPTFRPQWGMSAASRC
ncbi:MAG: LLM class flavin-dependent oxidoreductase [Roseovarius sp.]